MKVELKHKIRPQGEHNKLVYICPECDYDTFDMLVRDLAIGWFKVLDEWVCCSECPKCFTKWYHHDRHLDLYGSFVKQINLKNLKDI